MRAIFFVVGGDDLKLTREVLGKQRESFYQFGK